MAQVAFTPFACDGSGTKDITTEKLGGLTPNGAVFVVGGSTSTWDSITSSFGRIGLGMVDSGGTETAHCFFSEFNQPSTDTYSRYVTDECVFLGLANGGIDGEWDFNSWIENGIRVNVGNAMSSYRGLALFFADGNTDVSNEAPAATAALQTHSTSPAAPPDWVFTVGANSTVDTANVHNVGAIAALGGLGGAYGHGWWDEDNSAATDNYMMVGDILGYSNATSTVFETGHLCSMYGSGFQYVCVDWDTSNQPDHTTYNSTRVISCFGVELPSNISVAHHPIVARGNTTGVVYYPCGGLPLCSILALGGPPNWNDWDVGSVDSAIGYAIGMMDKDDEYSIGWSSEDAADPTDNESYGYTNAMRINLDSGATARVIGQRSVYLPGRVAIDWTTVDTSNCWGWMTTFYDNTYQIDVPLQEPIIAARN